MKKQTMPASNFDLLRFIQTVVDFWGDQETAFPLVAESGFADFGTDCLEDEAEEAGDTPLEWLQHGNALFGQFTRRGGSEYEYDLADGTGLDTEDGDEDNMQLDECTTYGFLVKLKSDILTIQTALLSDVTGECVVRVVKKAGIFEERMVRFVDSMKRCGDGSP